MLERVTGVEGFSVPSGGEKVGAPASNVYSASVTVDALRPRLHARALMTLPVTEMVIGALYVCAPPWQPVMALHEGAALPSV